MSEYKIETKCVQSGYTPKNGEPRVLPIVQSTTYKYDSTEHVGKLFDLEVDGHMYSRISNPTVSYVEEKLAALEKGTGALLFSSGQSATMTSVMNITSAGQNIICLSTVYGGTVNLLGVTLKRFGIETRFVNQNMSDAEIEERIDDNTRLIIGETIANPALTVLDIERFAKIAHKFDIPLIVDNTFATPILCNPFDFGADIVIHSTSKYLDGHATVLGGVIIDGGKFNWNNGKFPELSTPDESYHGVVYTENFGLEKAFITKARVQIVRDIGNLMAPMTAFLLNIGLETLHLRIQRHSENAMKVAQFLSESEKIKSINYPLLPSSDQYELAKKYVPNGASGVISFCMKGGREAAVKFMDSLKLAAIVVHVADARTCVLHPASATHRQLTDEQLIDCGIDAGMIRMSVGIENVEDIIDDIKQALNKI